MIEAIALPGEAVEAMWATMTFRTAFGGFPFGQALS